MLKKDRKQHIKNEWVYQFLKILPIKFLTAKQTLCFWLKIYESDDYEVADLRNTLNGIWNSRKTSFKPRNLLIKPLQVLLDSYKIYRNTCERLSIIPKKLFEYNKVHLKDVFLKQSRWEKSTR